MSQGNMLLGQARGKVGDLVFYVRQGKQQTRPRVRQVANPRTQAQMFQRVKLAGVVGFYKRQASLFRFALKKKAKESFYNAFVRYNLNLSPYLTREMSAEGWKIPAPYIIADGDMPSVRVTEVGVSENEKPTLVTDLNSNLSTWGLLRRNMGLSLGDMLSIVVFFGGEDARDNVKRVVIQHVFDVDTENMAVGDDMGGTYWGKVDEKFVIEIDNVAAGVSEVFGVAACIVISRNSGGVDCSFSQLTLNDTAKQDYDMMRTEAMRERAAMSYGEEAEAILDPRRASDNMVEFVQLYADASLTTPISSFTWTSEGNHRVYYNPNDLPSNIVGADAYVNGSWIEDVSVTWDEAGVFVLDFAEQTNASQSYELRYIMNDRSVVGYGRLTINKA